MLSFFDKPYSHLYLVGDNSNWVLDEETKSFKIIGDNIGYRTKIINRMFFNIPQIVHYTSQFSLLNERIYMSRNKISIDYFHGKPEHGGSYKKCFEMISRHKKDIAGIRVSHKEMKETLKASGIENSKIWVIPIGIDKNLFPQQTIEAKKLARQDLKIDQDAFVIGSFQKDGVGWAEGNEPKLIKGPDIFLKVVEKLKVDFPNLHVLLSGPSRGYVINGLRQLDIPYTHKLLKEYKEVSKLYDAIDLYAITSREEGGPKACLEAMAKGIPLVTTAVGQCKDLVSNGKNALMSPIEDADGLYRQIIQITKNDKLKESMIINGLVTAKENSYHSQEHLWKDYFQNLVHA